MNIFNYDQELKNEYLDMYKESPNRYRTLKSILTSIDKIESDIEKNILDWTIVDIENFLLSFNSRSKLTLYNCQKIATDYATWLEKKMINERNENILPNFFAACENLKEENMNAFNIYLNKSKFEKSLITKDEYDKIITDSNLNIFCRATIVLLYCGITDNCQELFDSKKEQIKDNKIISNFGSEIEISEKELDVIKEFIKIQKTILPFEQYSGINASDEETYLFIPHSEYIYHDYVGKIFPRHGQAIKRLNQEITPTKKFQSCYIANLLKCFCEKYKVPKFHCKEIIKSGAYYRMIMKLNLISGDLSCKKMDIMNSLAPYSMFQVEELEYLLEKMNR